MNELEKKVDALIRLCLADDGDDARAARKELECFAKQHRSVGGVSLRLQICRVLRELGVPEHLIGYEFLVDAVMLTVDKPDYLRHVTGALYPAVAKKHNCTDKQVERAMRHAIETAWNRCALEDIARYFGNTISPSRGKPVNSEFIARVANAVRMGE